MVLNTWCTWTRTASPTQCNKKFSKKILGKYGKSRILIARLDFSMVLLWRQSRRDFPRFANWTRPSGRRGNFYQVAQGQHPFLFALSSAESLSCPKSMESIGGTTIFHSLDNIQVVQKQMGAGLHVAAPVGFRRNLLIVRWVTPTPGCTSTANFPGNWYVHIASRVFCAHPADLIKSYL